jgi:hypothetical protein
MESSSRTMKEMEHSELSFTFLEQMSKTAKILSQEPQTKQAC